MCYCGLSHLQKKNDDGRFSTSVPPIKKKFKNLRISSKNDAIRFFWKMRESAGVKTSSL